MEELLKTLIEEARLNRETMTQMGRDLSSGLAAVKREVANLNREVVNINRRLDVLTEVARHGAAVNDTYDARIAQLEERVEKLEGKVE